MNQIARAMSLDEFLAWERGQEEKYEFDGRGPVAMTGGTISHRRISRDLTSALNDRLTSGCEAFDGDLKVLVAGRMRYPDVIVTCARLVGRDDIVPEPVFVAEILSPSTARTDRILKLDEYRHTPSIQYYLLLEQEAAEGILFTRDGDSWRAEPLLAPADIVLPALGVTLPIAEAYRRVAPPG